MTKKAIGVAPMETWGTTTATFPPTLQAVGAEMSFARVAAILGHPFTFSMNPGGGEVWQAANIDWWLVFEQMKLLPYELDVFSAVLKGSDPPPSPEALAAMKETTWLAVTASIDEGVPAIAWNARTVEHRDQGLYGGEWGLIVGYDTVDKSYVVRNQFNPEPWNVAFDGFGYADPVNWYCVIVPSKPKIVDAEEVTRQCLRQAVDYAEGARFELAKAPHSVAAVGLDAYVMWKAAFEKGDVAARFANLHAMFLRWARERAAEFCREVGRAEAADAYTAEVESLTRLEALCARAQNEGTFDTGARYEAIRHLETALAREREAIALIESSLEA